MQCTEHKLERVCEFLFFFLNSQTKTKKESGASASELRRSLRCQPFRERRCCWNIYTDCGESFSAKPTKFTTQTWKLGCFLLAVGLDGIFSSFFCLSISLPLFFTLTLRHACHNHRVSSKRLPFKKKKSILITLKLAFIKIFVHASFLFFEDEMHCSRVATRRIWWS